MSISFFKITPTELQFIDNTAAISSHDFGISGVFGADFHRDRSYSVVANLPMQAVDKIIHHLQSITVPAGETIVRQGGPADRFFIVLEGEAEVVRDTDGEQSQLATLKAGDLFGEVAIMRDEPRAASVRASSEVKLLALDRDSFRDLIAQAMKITPDFDQVIRHRLDAGTGL
jgi:CRP-like cAMP-binding protein